MPRLSHNVVTIGDAQLIVDPEGYCYLTLSDGRIGMLDRDNGGYYYIPPDVRDMLVTSCVAVGDIQRMLDDLNADSRAREELARLVDARSRRGRVALARGAQLKAASIHGPMQGWKHDAHCRPSLHDNQVALRNAMAGYLVVDVPPGFNDIMAGVAQVRVTGRDDWVVLVGGFGYRLGTPAALEALQEAAYTKRLAAQITASEFRAMADDWARRQRNEVASRDKRRNHNRMDRSPRA